MAPLDVDGEVSQLNLDRQTLLRGIMQVQKLKVRYKNSKVSALVCMLHKATIELNFENSCIDCRALRAAMTSLSPRTLQTHMQTPRPLPRGCPCPWGSCISSWAPFAAAYLECPGLLAMHWQ